MSDTPVDTDEVAHIADLARIDLDEDERDLFTEQFADILSYFETLDEVPEIEDDPELTNVMRPDEIEDSLDRDDALQNADDTEDGHFKGPRVS
jgi:aspartyl-tRNA(Asn)/glutamyl-tRNA(Gln) amidotransferase subunit C